MNNWALEHLCLSRTLPKSQAGFVGSGVPAKGYWAL